MTFKGLEVPLTCPFVIPLVFSIEADAKGFDVSFAEGF